RCTQELPSFPTRRSSDLLEQGNPSFPDAMFGTLLRNEQGKRFIDVHIEGGYFDRQWVGRGVAFADYDDDGRLDAAVVHHYQPASDRKSTRLNSSHVKISY